jgi:hypothetical protein
VRLQNLSEIIFSAIKNTPKLTKNNIALERGYTLTSNVGQAFEQTSKKIEVLLRVISEYLKESQNASDSNNNGEKHFERWFYSQYSYPEFIKLLKQKNRLDDTFIRNSFTSLTQFEYELIQQLIDSNLDFRSWNIDTDFSDDLWWKLHICKNNIERETKEKYQVRFFSKLINLFNHNDFKNHIIKFISATNLNSTFSFKLSKKNQTFFSDLEKEKLEIEWSKQLHKASKSHLTINTNYSSSLVSFHVIFNEAEFFFNKSDKKIKEKFLKSINIDTKDSCFPEANKPLEAFYTDLFSSEEDSTLSELEGEIWYARCKEDKVYPKNIWQAYLYLEYGILNTTKAAGDSPDNYHEWEEIELPMNEQFALSSICFEILGKIVLEDFIQNNETDIGLIKGEHFEEIWSEMNHKQRIAFENTFNRLKIDNISLNNILEKYADGKSIVFTNNPIQNNLDILLEDKNGTTSNLNHLGSGHKNIINIALEFVYNLAFSSYSEKKNLKIILIEPERFLHPNQCSSIVRLIYILYLFKQTKIENTNRLSPHITMVIETHSEYLIRSFQELIAEFKSYNGFNESFSINYFEKNEVTNTSTIRQIYIEKDGSLSDEFGSGFLDETELIIRNIINARQQ